MKIEAGKYYRTRNGKKAFVCGSNPLVEADSMFALLGYVDNEGPMTWNLDGVGVNIYSKYNLVEEWKDPQVFTVTVSIFHNKQTRNAEVRAKFGLPHKSIDTVNFDLLTQQTITLVEGEFNS